MFIYNSSSNCHNFEEDMLINEKKLISHEGIFFFPLWKKDIIKMNLFFSIYVCVCMYVFGCVCECVTTIRSNPCLVIMRGEITLTMNMKIESLNVS